ncbi:MAG: hypothetical protein RI963_3685 [Planctomycetota bacterium]|jgi:hypothetical protein
MGKDAEPKPIGFFVEQALDRIAGGDPRPATPPGQAMLRRYRLELVATGTDEEATRKLRGMLKMALRGFGLRCVEAVEIRDEEAYPPAGLGSSWPVA